MTGALFGTLGDGHPVACHALASDQVRLVLMEYGATIVRLETPDRDGRYADVVLGFDTLDQYLAPHPYVGGVVGRYANRIANGSFLLDGEQVQLGVNEGEHHLHGGVRGFDRCLWSVPELDESSVVFALTSPDGDEGYPGTMNVEVRYTLVSNRLTIRYRATADAPTVVNLSQHSYFNLAGHDRGDVTGHELAVAAAFYTPADEHLLPTGEILSVAGTPYDFRVAKPIGRDIALDEPGLRHGAGYDVNFVLEARPGPDGLHAAATLHEPRSGRTLEVRTDQPGLQFYTGNHLDGTLIGKDGVRYGRRHGLCLETQHFPNSPNASHFPSTVLRPGEVFESTTVLTFGAR
jgi:aldose 1-epimerase